MPIPLLDKLVSGFGGAYADADRVEVNRDELNNVQGDNLQDVANDLEGLFGTVSRIQSEVSPTTRPFVVWNESITITSANIATYADHNAVYAATTNQRVNFLLPLESAITTYPVVFEIQHLGGTARFDQGATPTNTITIDTQPGDTTSIESPANIVVQSVALHRGDIAIVVKGAAGQNWIVQEGSLDPRSTLLNDGIFTFSTRTINLTLNSGTGNHEITGLDNYSPVKGEGFEVDGAGITESSTFGRAINAKDVLVALVDGPNMVLVPTNEDWLIVHNAGSGGLTALELRFLSQIQESDTNFDTRLADDGVTNAVVWLSPAILNAAPFLAPSTDPNNPRTGQTVAYIGGTETLDANKDFTYNGQNIYSGNLYVGITPSYIATKSIANIYVQFNDIDGNFVNEFSLQNDFAKPSFADDATIAYYVYSGTTAADTFREIRYLANQTITLVIRGVDRHFTFQNSINPTTSIRELQESQLSQSVQGKLNRETSLQANDRERLDSIEVTQSTVAIPSNDYFRYKYGEISHVLSDYINLQIGDNIIGSFSTLPIVILVEDTLTVTNLTWSRGTIAVTQISPSIFDNYKTYTATIPGFAGSETQSPLDFPITITGTKVQSTATGFDTDIKIDRDNLTDGLYTKIFEDPYTLPQPLQALNSQASVFHLENANFISNNSLTGVASMFVYLKKSPDGSSGTPTYPITANDFVNEITGSSITSTAPTPIANVHIPTPSNPRGVWQASTFVIEGPGSAGGQFDINLHNQNNLNILVGFYLVNTQNEGLNRALVSFKRNDNDTFEPVIGELNAHLTAWQNNNDGGPATSRTITHQLAEANGLVTHSFSGTGTGEAEYRLYESNTYTIRANLRIGNDAAGSDSHAVTINLGTSTGEISFTLTFQSQDHGTNTQQFFYQYQAETHIYEGAGHTLHVQATNVAHINVNAVIDVSVEYSDTINTPATDNTFSPLELTNTNLHERTVLKCIFNLRKAESSDNLELAYSINGRGGIHTYNFGAGRYDYNVMRLINTDTATVIQNVQGAVLNQGILYEYQPTVALLNDWILHHDNIDDDYIWDNVSAPQGDVEAVHFLENVNFSNFILVAPNNNRYKLQVGNDGSLTTTLIT